MARPRAGCRCRCQPADYLVVGAARIATTDSDGQEAVCSINGTIVMVEVVTNEGAKTVPVLGTVTLDAAGPVTMDCGGFGVYTYSKRMFVTRVTSIING